MLTLYCWLQVVLQLSLTTQQRLQLSSDTVIFINVFRCYVVADRWKALQVELAYLASPLMNAAELVVFHFQREDHVVVEAKPHVRGATSRVKVANYFDVWVAHHFAVSSREFEREHLMNIYTWKTYQRKCSVCTRSSYTVLSEICIICCSMFYAVFTIFTFEFLGLQLHFFQRYPWIGANPTRKLRIIPLNG